MVKVKICGITNHEDAQKAAFYGAWAVGFIFYKKSPRYVSPSRARRIIEALPPFVTPVGVFVDQKERAVRDVCKFARINTVQFHGDESAVYCKRFTDFKIIKAFRVGLDCSHSAVSGTTGMKLSQNKDYGEFHFSPALVRKYKVDAYLFDAYKKGVPGGTGETFNWQVIANEKFDKPVILSGGLDPLNVREAIQAVNPAVVDVSSGVEKSPGVKDPRKIRDFFAAVNFQPTAPLN